MPTTQQCPRGPCPRPSAAPTRSRSPASGATSCSPATGGTSACSPWSSLAVCPARSDGRSMAHSLALRVPRVDHSLAERVFPLPARLKLGGWKRKHLLKRALAGRLPAAHLTAPKRGFVGPTAAWLRDELRPMLQDELSASRITRLGYFDPGAVARLIDEHCARRHNREGILWALLCFSTWHRLYV